jgi:hypothetical protein
MKNSQVKPNVIHYRLDKSFGPAGSTAGFFLLIVGAITIFESFSGAILILMGSFMAFSSSGSTVDLDNFRIRFTNDLFGIWRIGKWQYVSRKMRIGLSDAHMVYRVYSMSNRSVDVTSNDFRVYLYNEDGRKGMAICRFKKLEEAKEELAKLSDLLGLQIREGKHDESKGIVEIK